MKKIILITLVLIAAKAVAIAQTENQEAKKPAPSIIAVVNTAKWCPTCKANGARVEKEVISSVVEKSNFLIVINDLSDKDSKEMSKVALDKAGILDLMSKNKSTGVIYFIDAKSHTLINKISVAESSSDILAAFQSSLEKHN